MTPADGAGAALRLFRDAARTVPAYRDFLAANGVDPAGVTDLATVPLCTKVNYVQRYPLPERTRGGDLSAAAHAVAVSSGSSGEPTVWPRSVTDELVVARRFEHVLVDGFRAGERRTLVVVCFALGNWVGGMYTAAACRHLAAKGHPVTVATPGNNVDEILRVVATLGGYFDQTVLAGYPPFVKNVVDAGAARGVDWPAYRVKLLLAGEVFSEQWRDLMATRTGMTATHSASLYGTADAGVLGNETPMSVTIRRFLADTPSAAGSCSATAACPRSCSTTRPTATSRPTTERSCSPATAPSPSCATTWPTRAA
jgi:phenylacetate-CoA ligase